MKPGIHIATLTVVALALSAACGPKKVALAPTTPWEASLAEVFDDSVDFTANPESLSGQWLYIYQDQLKQRLKRAEYVLGVKIVSISRNTDPLGGECKDLYAEVKARVKGDYDQGSVTLRVCDNSSGFDSFKESDNRLYEKVFVAYLKLYTRPDGEVGIHWHLSPLSQGLKDGIDAVLKDEEATKSTGQVETFIYQNGRPMPAG